MRNRRVLFKLLWLIPLVLHSSNVLAWGLVTHVYFSQLLIWTLPLADPAIWRAARRFPRLVMAGSCLPDLLLMDEATFRHSHQWSSVQQLLDAAVNDEEKAIALGYATHLLADVVAHNHFVPAHEAHWLDRPLLTHIVAEWAMDGHIRHHVKEKPGTLLAAGRNTLAPFIAKGFACSEKAASKALGRLAAGETLLRQSRLPNVLYRASGLIDRQVDTHFSYYLGQTEAYLAGNIDKLLAGNAPLWSAEPSWSGETWKLIQAHCYSHLIERLHLPLHFFHQDPGQIDTILASAGSLTR